MTKRKKNKKLKNPQNSTVENPIQSSDDLQNLIVSSPIQSSDDLQNSIVESPSRKLYNDFKSKTYLSPRMLIKAACKLLTHEIIELAPDYNEICRDTWTFIFENNFVYTDPMSKSIDINPLGVVHMIWDQAMQMESSILLSQPFKFNTASFAKYTMQTELLHYALVKDYCGLVNQIFKSPTLKNIILAEPRDWEGVTPIEKVTLYSKADTSSKERMLKLLLENQISIDMQNLSEQGALYRAALGRKLDMVKLLLKLGARDILNKYPSGEYYTAERCLEDKHGVDYPAILKVIQNHNAQLSLKDSTTSVMIKGTPDAVKQTSKPSSLMLEPDNTSEPLSLMLEPDNTSDFRSDFYSTGDIYKSENIEEDVYLSGGAAPQVDQS